MKNIRDVYQKLREVKHYHVVKLYKFYNRKVPENCKYNHQYEIYENKTSVKIGLCLLHQPNLDLRSSVYPHLIDICQFPHHCSSCNGFAIKYSKEEIKDIFEEELKNIKLKEKKYPDICALEWVLEKSVIGLPPFSTIQKIYYAIKRWLSKNKML